jgi:hypothetical protein
MLPTGIWESTQRSLAAPRSQSNAVFDDLTVIGSLGTREPDRAGTRLSVMVMVRAHPARYLAGFVELTPAVLAITGGLNLVSRGLTFSAFRTATARTGPERKWMCADGVVGRQPRGASFLASDPL